MRGWGWFLPQVGEIDHMITGKICILWPHAHPGNAILGDNHDLDQDVV